MNRYSTIERDLRLNFVHICRNRIQIKFFIRETQPWNPLQVAESQGAAIEVAVAVAEVEIQVSLRLEVEGVQPEVGDGHAGALRGEQGERQAQEQVTLFCLIAQPLFHIYYARISHE